MTAPRALPQPSSMERDVAPRVVRMKAPVEGVAYRVSTLLTAWTLLSKTKRDSLWQN